ncbi:MAG: signal peptidase II [Patescibacteria group bacterium]
MNKLFAKISLNDIATALAVAIFFITDRYLKSLALNSAGNAPFKLIGDIFSFHFVANSYISFSLPLRGWLINFIILLIIGLLTYYIFYLILNKKEQKIEIILLTLVLFGAISNILDRFIYGYVVDYLELRYFTVFNLADIMISGGVFVLLFNNLKGGKFDKV